MSEADKQIDRMWLVQFDEDGEPRREVVSVEPVGHYKECSTELPRDIVANALTASVWTLPWLREETARLARDVALALYDERETTAALLKTKERIGA
jgi:hypothetical protein